LRRYISIILILLSLGSGCHNCVLHAGLTLTFCAPRRSFDDTLVPNCIHLNLPNAYPNSNYIMFPLLCTGVVISGVAIMLRSII
jgi:hypothetical protein